MKSGYRSGVTLLLAGILFCCMSGQALLLGAANHPHVVGLANDHRVNHVILFHPTDSEPANHETLIVNGNEEDHEFHMADFAGVLQKRPILYEPAQPVSPGFQRRAIAAIPVNFAVSFERDIGVLSKPAQILRI